MGVLCLLMALPAPAQNLSPANTRPVPILSKLDIDGDGCADEGIDSDGDGLPDNWEVGGTDATKPTCTGGAAVDRFVNFSAPTAIGPGTPPTFVSARLTVTTSALLADTDNDGLTDFIEVFGLKYIDDNGNGILDFNFTDTNLNGQWDPGETITYGEWLDLNNDGLPSIGERPIDNGAELLCPTPQDPDQRCGHDFDGFVFTDPTLADTDGDGILDGNDPDPLINPETFGVPRGTGFTRIGAPTTDLDFDNDGLGNGSDFGNDLTEEVDYPTDIAELMALFRPDREDTIPESLIEDLIGADWDGNGLFRITDIRGYRENVTEACLQSAFPDRFAELFLVGERRLFGEPSEAPATPCARPTAAGVPAGEDTATTYGSQGQRMGMQEIVLPAERSTPLFPDVRVWTILYAWRVPGFDIDGDGYVGSPENSFVFDDRHPFTGGGRGVSDLDGVIDAPSCGPGSVSAAMTASLALVLMPLTRRRRPRQ
jgi:hypothetical protein